jgi:hypothetical protein
LAGGGRDGVVNSVVRSVILQVSLLAAPFPIFRIPAWLTPRIYSIGLLMTILSNFGLLFISFHVYDGSNLLEERLAWQLLSTATLIICLSGAVFFYHVPVSHKHTFYRHLTFSQYINNNLWNVMNTWIDHHSEEVQGLEACRAMMTIKFSHYYMPVGKVIAFYESCWSRWVEERPDWFDEDFRKQVPREYLVKVEKRLRIVDGDSDGDGSGAGNNSKGGGGGGGEVERKAAAITPL